MRPQRRPGAAGSATVIHPARLAVAAHQLRCEAAFRKVKGIFSQLGIEIIVLKGPHLGNTIYENPWQRLYGDLDLLVKPRDFQPAAAALEKNSFKPLAFAGFNKRVQDDFKHWEYQSPQGIVVELHRWLSGHDRYPIAVDGLFARAESFTFGETAALGLGTEDLLLHLCLHMGTSYFQVIERKHIQDIALLIGKREVDWPMFMKRVGKAGAGTIAYYALSSAQLQRSAKIPDRVVKKLRPGFFRRWWIEKFIDASHFPVYRFPSQPIKMAKRKLIFPFMDRPSQWIRFVARIGNSKIKAMGKPAYCS